MSKPLVSVIITCYNYANYVEEAIQSVLGQSYDNIQLIVINDGSTDDSHSVIYDLHKKHKFEYINKENEGVIKTRNLGVSLAKGEYQAQLDADDYLDPSYIEKCIKRMDEVGVDIVYTQVRHFGRDEFDSQYIDFNLEKLKHANYIHASSLVRSSILEKDPYDYYLNDKGYEDWDLFLGLCLKGSKAVLVDEPILNYRKHTARKSRSDSIEGTNREMLVRHHIWSKYNSQFPEEFWYFSSEINLLLDMINLKSEYESTIQNLEKKISEMKSSWRMKGSRYNR